MSVDSVNPVKLLMTPGGIVGRQMRGGPRTRKRASGKHVVRTRSQTATLVKMAEEPQTAVSAYDRRTNLLRDTVPVPMPASEDESSFDAVKNAVFPAPK